MAQHFLLSAKARTLSIVKIAMMSDEDGLQTMESLSVLLVVQLLNLAVIISYKIASEVLFKTIEFGLIELKYQLIIEKESNTSNKLLVVVEDNDNTRSMNARKY